MISNRRQEFIIHSIFRNTQRGSKAKAYSTMNFSCSFESIGNLCKLHVCRTVIACFSTSFFLSRSFWFVCSFCSVMFENRLPKIENWNKFFFLQMEKSATRISTRATRYIGSTRKIVSKKKIHLNDRIFTRLEWWQCVCVFQGNRAKKQH